MLGPAVEEQERRPVVGAGLRDVRAHAGGEVEEVVPDAGHVGKRAHRRQGTHCSPARTNRAAGAWTGWRRHRRAVRVTIYLGGHRVPHPALRAARRLLRRAVRRERRAPHPWRGARRGSGRARLRRAGRGRPAARRDLHGAGDHVRLRRSGRRGPGARPAVPARPRAADHPGGGVDDDQARAGPAHPRAQRVHRRRLPRARDRPRGPRAVGPDRLALGLRATRSSCSRGSRSTRRADGDGPVRPPVPARPGAADHPGRRVAHDQARARAADPRAERFVDDVYHGREIVHDGHRAVGAGRRRAPRSPAPRTASARPAASTATSPAATSCATPTARGRCSRTTSARRAGSPTCSRTASR